MHEQLSQWWSRVSLRTKTTGVTVLLVTVGLLVAGIGTMTVLRNYLVSEVDRKIASTFDDLRTLDLDIDQTCIRASGPSQFFVAILAPDGSVLCQNRDAEQARRSDRKSAFTLPLSKITECALSPSRPGPS